MYCLKGLRKSNMKNILIVFFITILFCSCKHEQRYSPIKKGVLVIVYENTGKTDTISYEKDSTRYLEYKHIFPIEDGSINVIKVSSGNYKINDKKNK